MALNVGDKAPEFTLYDTGRKQRSLKEFLGKKTVLAFFPGAFTGVCTKEMCTFRDSLSVLDAAGAHLVAISVDAPAANKGFADVNKFTFPILSDYTHEVSKKYGGVHDAFGGLPGLVAAKRAVFVLDAGGTVRYAWISEDPGREPPYDEVKRAVADIH